MQSFRNIINDANELLAIGNLVGYSDSVRALESMGLDSQTMKDMGLMPWCERSADDRSECLLHIAV